MVAGQVTAERGRLPKDFIWTVLICIHGPGKMEVMSILAMLVGMLVVVDVRRLKRRC